MNADSHAAELLAAYDAAAILPLRTAVESSFDMKAAYVVADRIRTLRLARGERQAGYKIGFTNRTIWERYGVHGPIWAPVWDTTTQLWTGTHAEVSLRGLVQPRLEPEVAFGFAKSPRVGMSESDLIACLDWVAHSFEIVHTHFDGWRFQAADTVADFALHGRLCVGPRVALERFDALGAQTAALQVTLACDGAPVDEGRGDNVLDGPLRALRLWIDAMLSQEHGWRIEPGHVVTTGTITDAAPMRAGQEWTTRLSDKRLAGLTLRTTA